MATVTIETPDKVEKIIADLIEQLGGKVVASDSKTKKLTRKEKEFLKGFDEAVEFVNEHKEGKVKAKDIGEFFNGKTDDHKTPYNPEFVAKIEKSMKQADEGKVVKIDLDDISKPDKVVASDSTRENRLTKKEKDFLKGFEEAVDFVNNHREGKVKAKTLGEFLNEL